MSVVTVLGIVVYCSKHVILLKISARIFYIFFVGPCCTKDFINLKASVVAAISLNFSYTHAATTMLSKPHVFLTITLLDPIFKTREILPFCIGLSGKFVPMLKENWNAEDLNFSIHLLNYIG